MPQAGAVSVGLGSLHPSLRPTRGKSRKGFIAGVIVAGLVIAAAAIAAIMLFTGGAAVLDEEAAVAGTPDRAHDRAAQTLLRNAMTVMDSAFIEAADYTTISQSQLETVEPGITWVHGKTGLYRSPSVKAVADANAVAWVCVARLVYELGTRSASGAKFGVKVDRAGGGITYYKDGQVVSGW